MTDVVLSASAPAPAPAGKAPHPCGARRGRTTSRTGASAATAPRLALGAGWLASLVAVAALVACGGGSGEGAGALSADATGPVPGSSTPSAPVAAAGPTPVSAPSAGPSVSAAAPAAWGSPIGSARIFISGHSLTDNPLGDQLVSVANGLLGSNAARYNQQIVIGSPLRVRAAGNSADTSSWPGFRSGKNRDGTGMDVARELRSPTTLGGDRYDTLVLAENHNLLEMLQWENTVRYLRQAHDLGQAGSPGARSFLYETWFNLNDRSDPAAWIAHERAASRAWQCVATRVNTALAAEGRSARITPLPAGAALVDLVERATQGQVPGITQSGTAATVATLMSDNVHLTPTGMYYMALVSYSAIYQRSPVGAPAPSGVSATAARSLQEAAWRFVSDFYANYQAPTLDACRTEVAQNFCSVYWNYRGQPNTVAGCRNAFSAANGNNPLFFDAGANAGYWFALP